MSREDVFKHEQHLFSVLSGKRFLQMEGLGNEVPFFIYPYDPEDALEVAKSKKRIKNRLASNGVEVREVNLYDLSVEILKEREAWDRLLALEPEQDKGDFRELLQGMLDPQLHIAPAIRANLAEGDFDIFFLTGIGEVFPYIRSLEQLAPAIQGMITGSNSTFLRLWHEVAFDRLELRGDLGWTSGKRWTPYNKGGESRRWYGAQSHVVDWSNRGRDFVRNRSTNNQNYFREYLS